MEGKIDLAKSRAGEQNAPLCGEQGGIGAEMDLQSLLVTVTQQLLEFGVKERFAEEMQGDMICPAVNLLQSFGKCCRGDKGWRPLTLVAKATG